MTSTTPFKRVWEIDIPVPIFPLKTAIEAMQGEPVRWLVKKLLPAQGLTIVFGASNSGKTFTVTDLAMALSTDCMYWMGHRCNGVGVVYLALEGSLSGRLQAWSAAHPDANLYVATFAAFEGSANLFDGKCIPDLAREINDHAQNAGWRPGLIIIDTLVRACPGADENSVQDMSAIVRNMKRLEDATGCAIMAIHHSGKNTDAGMRGSTALLGAADQILQVAVRDGYRELTVYKSRDGTKDTRIEFDLQIVNIGTDEDGDEITSCVVRQLTDTVPRRKSLPMPKGKNQEAVFKELCELLKGGKSGVGGAPNDRPSVALEELLAICKERLPIEAKRISERVRTAVQTMATTGVLVFQGDRLWLPSHENGSSDGKPF